MRKEKQTIKDKAQTYGFQAMTDNELVKLTGFKGDDFYSSQSYKAFKELMRRQEAQSVKKITCSNDAYNLLSFLDGLDHEQFWAIYLKQNNSIIKTELIGKGGQTSCIADTKVIMKQALNCGAQAIILAHNHPSGELSPSPQDMNITKTIKDAAKLFDIAVFDHIIVGDGKQSNKYYSFADEQTIF